MMEKIEKGHPLSQSTDFVAENIETLKKLFPTIVKEGKIDIKELQALLGEEVETGEEYYHFTWAGKSMARREANKLSTGTLRPDKESSKNWDTTQNLFIEGDNLEVLKLLHKSYANKVKMIYIDPPYNTGKDFVYKDNYNDNLGNYLQITGQLDEEGKKTSTNSESDGRFHSNWLNMMYPRLIMAKKLLKDDGVIFISIDDNEEAQLRFLLNEVFGEENFINEFIWKNGRTSSAIFTKEQEYILAYGKKVEKIQLINYEGDEKQITERAIKKIGTKNPPSKIFFPKGIRFESEDKIFPKQFGDSEVVRVIEGDLICKDKKLAEDVVLEAGWVMKDMIENWIKGGDVIDSKGQKVVEFYFKSNGVLQYIKEKGTVHPKTIIEGCSTKQGTNEILNFFNTQVFEFPKPTSLIKFLLSITSKNDLILDFFAGSGTSGDAVMQLNAEDGGIRKFICVQLPEPTEKNSDAFKAGYKTISAITKERIRRAGDKIKTEKQAILDQKTAALKKAVTLIKDQESIDKLTEEIAQLESALQNLDIGFKAFKLDSSNIRAWDGSPEALESNLFSAARNIKEGRAEEDVLYEILLKYGLDLTMPIEERVIGGKQVFNIGLGALFICLGDNITTAVAEGIGAWKEELQPATTRVIFKDTGFTDVEKTNSMQVLKRFGIEEVNTI